jgi:hypothetical protein
MQVHFYWLGAVPALLFLALFMMPLYYGIKVLILLITLFSEDAAASSMILSFERLIIG